MVSPVGRPDVDVEAAGVGWRQAEGHAEADAVTVIPESAGAMESLTGFDDRLAREIVEAAIDRYLAAAHERIAPFVDAHFSFPGAYDLHRRAIGRDLARAPTNVVLAVPRLLLQMGSWSARRAGWDRGDRLGKWEQKLILKTDVARELDWLIRTELLQLPYREEHPPYRDATRDALAEAVFTDPRIEAAGRDILEVMGRRADDPGFREGFESKLAVYTGSRAAASEITTAMFSVAVGAGFKQMTTGALSLGPVLAGAITQHAAIAGFPLGAGLGSIWYGAFPASVGTATTVTVTGGLVLAFSLLSALAGVLADPAQKRLGLHQRRLKRLIDAIGQDLKSDLKGDDSGRFRVCDHYVARILDLADLLRATWRALG